MRPRHVSWVSAAVDAVCRKESKEGSISRALTAWKLGSDWDGHGRKARRGVREDENTTAATGSNGRDSWSSRERAEYFASVPDERLAVGEKQVVEVELGEPPICLA
jgi:hypothetical protein